MEHNKNPFKEGGMFDGANHLIFGFAKDLRRNMTDAGKILWNYLKAGIYGLKFRRQHPFGLYVADFYCHKIKLIIELDGSIHELDNVKENDERRQKELETPGYTIIRFTNDHVIKELEKVINEIKNIVINYSSK